MQICTQKICLKCNKCVFYTIRMRKNQILKVFTEKKVIDRYKQHGSTLGIGNNDFKFSESIEKIF